MKEAILQAEVNVNMAQINRDKNIEINLLLAGPGETRRYRQIQRPVNSHSGYPSSMPERKGYTGGDADDGKYRGFESKANVKVNTVLVNVNTRRANY